MNTAGDTAASSAPDPRALKDTGVRLRQAIDHVYKSLKADRGVRANDSNGSDVSPTVRGYLPIGMKLDDAESILRFAGFNVRREARRERDDAKPPDIVGSIEPLERGFLWAYHSGIKVKVIPNIIDGIATVGDVIATIKFPMS